MAKRRKRALVRADQFHAKVVDLLGTRHDDWGDWEATFLFDNARRPDDFIYSDAQWTVLERLVRNSHSFTQYGDYSVQELLAIVYPFRADLNEDDDEFVETLKRWKAIDLKRRQIGRLARLARLFAPVGRDDLDLIEEDDLNLEKVFFSQDRAA